MPVGARGWECGPKMAKISTFGNVSPTLANPLTDFYNCYGLLYAQIPHVSNFIFEMIHFTGYRVIAEKPRVRRLSEIYIHPVGKAMIWMEK